jgi:hypothetical protein
MTRDITKVERVERHRDSPFDLLLFRMAPEAITLQPA